MGVAIGTAAGRGCRGGESSRLDRLAGRVLLSHHDGILGPGWCCCAKRFMNSRTGVDCQWCRGAWPGSRSVGGRRRRSPCPASARREADSRRGGRAVLGEQPVGCPRHFSLAFALALALVLRCFGRRRWGTLLSATTHYASTPHTHTPPFTQPTTLRAGIATPCTHPHPSTPTHPPIIITTTTNTTSTSAPATDSHAQSHARLHHHYHPRRQ